MKPLQAGPPAALLVSANVALALPGRLAVTLYGPPTVALAVAVVCALPLASMLAMAGTRLALAPLPGAVNVTWPPSTGSAALLAVTLAMSGWVKAVAAVADWLPPLAALRAKPRDSNAPTSTLPVRTTPRWSFTGVGRLLPVEPTLTPALMARLPGNSDMVEVGPPWLPSGPSSGSLTPSWLLLCQLAPPDTLTSEEPITLPRDPALSNVPCDPTQKSEFVAPVNRQLTTDMSAPD